MRALASLLTLAVAACCPPPPAAAPPGRTEAVTVGETLETLAGTVLQKPWTQSEESWNAGGSDYLVLDVGAAAVRERSAAEGVTLLASDSVTVAALAALVGKRVRVEGEYVAARAYTPSSPTDVYPTGIDGKPLPRGAGFRVRAVIVEP